MDGKTANTELPCTCPKGDDTTNECTTGTPYCNFDGTCKEAAEGTIQGGLTGKTIIDQGGN